MDIRGLVLMTREYNREMKGLAGSMAEVMSQRNTMLLVTVPAPVPSETEKCSAEARKVLLVLVLGVS